MRDDGIIFEGEHADGTAAYMVIDGERVQLPTREELAADDAREQREISEYWDRYYALPWREKIRGEGITHWVSSTNTGALLALLATILAVAAVAWISGS